MIKERWNCGIAYKVIYKMKSGNYDIKTRNYDIEFTIMKLQHERSK